MSEKNYHDMIKKLRDERVDVEAVYIGEFQPEKDTIEEVVENVVQLDEPYIPQRFRDETKEEIAKEIFEIAESACIEHLMSTAETEIPVYSMEKHYTLTEETEVRSDHVDHVDMGELIGLMGRNWKELKQLTLTEIRNAMKHIYCEVDEVVMEAAIDTALHVVRAGAHQ